jgi:hypothetical protein
MLSNIDSVLTQMFAVSFAKFVDVGERHMTWQSRKNETLQHQRRRRLIKMKEDKKTNSVSLVDASSWAPVEEGICVLAQNRNSISAKKKARRNFAFGVTWGSVFLFFFASGAASGDGEKGQNQSKV